jgi:transcription elongation GreA/GreB family factor
VDLPDKAAVHRALREALAKALETMVLAAKDTAEGATHEENRSEGDKDMRATEQSYLARGQAMRAEELAEALSRFEATRMVSFGEDDAIANGALVHVELEDEERVIFLAAQGGGTVLDVGGVRVTVVTPSSPMGGALLGKREGDDFELVVRGQKREGAVLALC